MTEANTAYTIGRSAARAFSERPWLAFVLVVLAVVIYSSTEDKPEKKQISAQPSTAIKGKCSSEKSTLLGLSNKAKEKGNFYDAAYMLSECATELNDPELKSEFLENAIKHWREVTDSKLSTDKERSFAYKKLAELDTANSDSHLQKHKKFEKLAEAKEAKDKAIAEAKLKREKKSKGVHIGMTTQDVLDSSWGRPEKINRSMNEYGTREQWVYPGYNYLYFDDGILKTIHTSSN